ncbi:pyridoxamine 5'-phosphate oxidase family protein [Nocardia iowensis]|uniref:Pyridoxamine 5'-phosphate oxidase family protein n=1 Tax=Nocardia iowensis TaxID=204891 RepID=A0ABX8RZ93_NOCIO|nr:pyridoxamine 5'-phosphate oxidase family protein [Nocardia iowensis]QXN94972.1 pyridoxamine 5'-phosphate oxidase family protein [Nocardia iowensis]
MTVDNTTTEPMQPPTPRSLGQRRADALKRLGTNHQMWLATAGEGYGPHLIPVSYTWNTNTLTTATFEHSRTVANLHATPRARVAIGDTADVIMIEATASLIPVDAIDPTAADGYAQVSHDPRTMPGFVYIQLAPQRIQVWNGFHEFTGRTVMADGQWLDRPID